MSTRLRSVIAVEGGVRSDVAKRVEELTAAVQTSARITGLSRTYAPLADDGVHLPPESQIVQLTAEGTLREITATLTRLFDVTLTKETGNRFAVADVVIDGRVILEDAPLTYLLFLDKQLGALRNVLLRMPEFDTAVDWQWDDNRGWWKSPPVDTVRNKRVLKNHTVAEATPHHPAQVQTYPEDVPEGTWTTVKFTGALSPTRRRILLDRLTKLQDAVKVARQEANSLTVDDKRAGEQVFGYLFAA